MVTHGDFPVHCLAQVGSLSSLLISSCLFITHIQCVTSQFDSSRKVSLHCVILKHPQYILRNYGER